MLVELLVATAMVCITVVIHGWGLSLLAQVLRAQAADEDAEHLSWTSPRAIGFTIAMVLGLFCLHGLEIWLYAALYHRLGAVADLHTAVYFSTATYGAIGYGETEMARHWRLLGAVEGINGVLLMGWTTAFFVTMMSRFGPARRAARKPRP